MGSVKMIMMSSGGVLIAILVSLWLNPVVKRAASGLPSVWSTLSAWLTPPYLYVIINGIIISIAASSGLHHHHHHHHHKYHVQAEEQHYSDSVEVHDEETPTGIAHQHEMTDMEIEPHSFLQKPPPLSRFAPRPPPPKSSPVQGGKALRRVAKTKRHETLESTWKAITEGRAMPLTRHLKKSDTWENHSRQINMPDSNDLVVKKSETFKQRTNHVSPLVPSSRLRKEPSLSQDELNSRVEAFINKFNEEMRLQRQQSIEQFMDKINRI